MLPSKLQYTQNSYNCNKQLIIANKYNIFELISILDNNDIPIDCYLNKPALIYLILHYQLELQDKQSISYTPIKAIGRHLLYNSNPLSSHNHHSYCITIYNNDDIYIGTITEKDIIDIYDIRYIIHSIYCDKLNFKNDIELYIVILENVKTKEHTVYSANEFVKLFQTDKITYLYNKTRNLIMKLNKRI